jgi:hypothetical protein
MSYMYIYVHISSCDVDDIFVRINQNQISSRYFRKIIWNFMKIHLVGAELLLAH